MIPLSVTASAANFEMPSRSFSTAICCSLKSKRKEASSSMYVCFEISKADALVESSFWVTGLSAVNNSSKRFG